MLRASVIIPTYNRPESLKRTLVSLANQDFNNEIFEVIVVDDGSSMNYKEIIGNNWPYLFSFIQQEHKGCTQAKNQGASIANGEIIFFIDDDIEVNQNYLSSLISIHNQNTDAIVMGQLVDIPENPNSLFGKIYSSKIDDIYTDGVKNFPFHECMGGFFSIGKRNFFELGQLKDIGEWPNWEHLSLAYKAYQTGYRFLLVTCAIGYHHDHTLKDLNTYCRRWMRAAKTAVILFNQYPGLQEHIPMFRDKSPISFSQDSLLLISRKLLRTFTAWAPILWGLERCAHIFETRAPYPFLLRPFYRWINSSYIYKGYRQGLKENRVS